MFAKNGFSDLNSKRNFKWPSIYYGISALQRFQLNLYLNNNEENIVNFITRICCMNPQIRNNKFY